MDLIRYFSATQPKIELPEQMPDPFDTRPHAIAMAAAAMLRQRIDAHAHWRALLHRADGGKMFGVLVVHDDEGRLGYLSAFSGMLDSQWVQPGFAPPIFDRDDRARIMRQGEARLAVLGAELDALQQHPLRRQWRDQLATETAQLEQQLQALQQRRRENRQWRHCQREQTADAKTLAALSQQSQQDKRACKRCRQQGHARLQELQQRLEARFEASIDALKRRRKRLSRRLHLQLFDGYQLRSFDGRSGALRDFYSGREPPGGSGDCAAPKLLQLAARRQWRPVALAEFWYGAAASGSVRRHGEFYPPCRGKCHPILPFMLQGVVLTPARTPTPSATLQPEIIFEDDHLLVLNKPAGLLSTPGKRQPWSVQSWLQQRYPQAHGVLLAHRLDMATSGLLLAAKSARAHKKLQRQFIHRSIRKRYVAIVSRQLPRDHYDIDLPLRVDLDDRPRQRVCDQHGKPAQTRVEVIERMASTTRVYFYPHTGRTHQLRVHAAHPLGLDAPIVGDDLYGAPAQRLCLHAERLDFTHPVQGHIMRFQLDAGF